MMPARLDAVGASVPTDRSKRKASPYIPSSRRRPGSRRSFQVRTKGQNIVLRTSKILSGIRHAPCETRRSEEHTSELQSLMRISYEVFCSQKKKRQIHTQHVSS